MIDPADHIERIVAVSKIGRYGLTVLVGLSVSETLDEYFRMRRLYLTMAILTSIVLVSFSGWIMALIVKLLSSREELRRLSETDRLTGLFNRGHIKELLRHAVMSPDVSGKIAAIFIDLDNFKQLNDTYGHHAGDEVPTILAARLRSAVGNRGLVARLGGDEFLVVVGAEEVAQLVTQVAEEIVRSLATAVTVQREPYLIRASLGTAVLERGDTVDELLRKADHAMYQAKQRGRSCNGTTWYAHSTTS